jgi:tetratricopeptide (TPR) repeat protein
MIFDWFNAREAAKIGASLADEFAPKQISTENIPGKHPVSSEPDDALRKILLRADAENLRLNLNFYKKAKLANSFKWRLLENGVDKALADEVTEKLALYLADNQRKSALRSDSDTTGTDQLQSKDAQELLAQGNRSMARGDYSDAITFYQDLITLKPKHVVALNNLGAASFKLGRFEDAQGCFRQ